MQQTERTPLAALYHWEQSRPDRLHFTQPVGGGQVVSYTWAEAMTEARKLAAYLRSLNLPAGSQIALLGKNSAHWMIADWAIWMCGHVTVPIYPTLNADTVAYILEHSEAKLLIVGRLDDWQMMAAGVPDSLPMLRLPLAADTRGEDWETAVAGLEPITDSPDRSLDDLATIVYTSGSTGRPKGVMLNFRSFYLVGNLLNDRFPVGEEDRMLSYLPLAHVAERLVVENNSVYHGFQVFFAESLETFVADLQRARPTMFFSVPRLWTKFHLAVCDKLPLKKQKVMFRIPVLGKKVKHKILTQLGLGEARIGFTGAAPLPPAILDWYRSLGLELLEAYGMSENCAYSHFTKPGDAKTGYVGTANPGVECRIAENGEILVKSPAQMLGYYKNPEATAEAITEDGFFKTGDMGVLDEAGRLRITGRVKELFKTSKGKYVAPVPIENKLGAHPAIEVVCVGGANQPATLGLVLLSDELRRQQAAGSLDKEALAAELSALTQEVNSTLDPHEQLQCLVVVPEVWGIENGFLTPTMKIKRNVIEAHYENRVEEWMGARQTVIFA